MPIVRNFIRRSSIQGLQEYITDKKIPVMGIDWAQDQTTIANNVIQLLDHLPPEDQERFKVDAERIHHMTDEFGQAALLEAMNGTTAFIRMESALDRARWVFLRESDRFRNAEDIRYADQYRYGSNWSGFQVSEALRLYRDSDSVKAFKSKLKKLLGMGKKIKVEIFDRTMADDEGNSLNTFQFMIYQEGVSNSYLEFEGDENVVTRIRHPVSEHAITYVPETGIIEVVAAKRERRGFIAKAFIEEILKQPIEAGKLPLRQYCLRPLIEDKPLDWDLNDNIDSVQLIMLKLQDTDKQGRIIIEVPARNHFRFHDYCRDYFGDTNPVTSNTFVPIQAIISIKFQPEEGSNRKKVLPVKITLPNGCNLRSRTERERLIGEKYLKRWGLVTDV